MKLSDFVVTGAILPELKAEQRDDAINEMMDALVESGACTADLRDDLVKLILDREKHGSTGFGKGVAVPHVKHDQIEKMSAAVAVSSKGVDFNALDKEPVYAIFLLLSPKGKPDEHLQAMENIFSNLQNDTFRKFLRQSDSAGAIQELLAEADAEKLSR